MSYKVGEKLEESEVKSGCQHHWIIGSADGLVSRGVCKFCGAEKEFLNSCPDSSVTKRNSGNFELPDLPEDAEPDEERDDSELKERGAALRV